MKRLLEEEKRLTEDRFLRKALNRLRENYFKKRKRVEELFDLEHCRFEVRRIKEANVDILDENLKLFVDRVNDTTQGVFVCGDKKEALETIEKILIKEGVRRIIKSKSLTTEELELNSFLINKGFEVVETDLGEWLVQINGEKPTHMTAPAIHLSREKILELLSRTFGVELPDNLDAIVEFCKKKIRESFGKAECGVIGANVASIESGSFFILSNEGNIQNVLKQRVVIAVLGVDKIVKSDEEAFKIVELLPKAATGQITTSYLDVLRKPFGKFYVILVDNGRRKIAREGEFREALYCIHCGACQNACPIYTTVSGRLFRGKTYSGPVGVMLSFACGDSEGLFEFANMCIGCMACDEICSSKIGIQHIILKIKALTSRDSLTPKRLIIRHLENRYDLMRIFAYFLSFLFKNGIKTGIDMVDRALGVEYRMLPGIKPSFDISIMSKKSKICLFPGCSINFFYDRVGRDALSLAHKLNIELSIIKQKSCCGAPAWYNGEEQSSVEAARINVEYLLSLNCDRILFLDPHCAHMVQRDYTLFLKTEKAQELSSKVICAGNFFLDRMLKRGVSFGRLGAVLGYHHPCHLKRGLNGSIEQEEFLAKNEPNYVEIKDKDRCCGFAGSYSFMHPYISKSLLKEKLLNIQRASLQVLITACPGCMMQIEGGIRARGEHIEVLHFVSYLNRIL